MINALADFVVGVVRAGYRRRAWLSAGALVMTLVVAGAYLMIGALRVKPFDSSYRITIELPESARPAAQPGRHPAWRAGRERWNG